MGRLLILVLAASITPAAAQPAWQRSADTMHSLRLAERNHLGLLQYCRDQGLVGDDVVAQQQRALNELRSDGGDEEEAAGRQGVIAFAKPQASFADDAKAKGVTVRFNCEESARRVTPAR